MITLDEAIKDYDETMKKICKLAEIGTLTAEQEDEVAGFIIDMTKCIAMTNNRELALEKLAELIEYRKRELSFLDEV